MIFFKHTTKKIAEFSIPKLWDTANPQNKLNIPQNILGGLGGGRVDEGYFNLKARLDYKWQGQQARL